MLYPPKQLDHVNFKGLVRYTLPIPLRTNTPINNFDYNSISMLLVSNVQIIYKTSSRDLRKKNQLCIPRFGANHQTDYKDPFKIEDFKVWSDIHNENKIVFQLLKESIQQT